MHGILDEQKTRMTEITSPIFRIAVTGHRFLSDNNELSNAIRAVLDRIIQEHSNTEITLFSALAEGSDQLVAEIALSYQRIRLIVPLPLSEEDYLMGFVSDIGRKSFHELVQSAEKVYTLPEHVDHPTAYEYLGNYLLDHCEAMLAIWNGIYTLKRGGTGELVKKALKMEKLIYWIYADNGNEEGEVRIKLHKNPGDIEILGDSGDSIGI
jgi:hypothetical protein